MARTFFVLRAATWLLLLVILGGFLLVAGGVFDPRPAGSLTTTLTPGRVRLDAGEEYSGPLESSLGEVFTLVLQVEHPAGERDVAYGLRLEAGAESLLVLLSPTGYASVEIAGEQATTPLPFQPWPHVRPDSNELWLERQGRQWQVRVNRELLWMGVWEPAGDLSPTLYVEAYEQARVDFARLEVWEGEMGRR